MIGILSHLYTTVLFGAFTFGPTAALVYWKGRGPLFAILAWLIFFIASGLGLFGSASVLIPDKAGRVTYLLIFFILTLTVCGLAVWTASRIPIDRVFWLVVALPIALWSFLWSNMFAVSVKRLVVEITSVASGRAD